MDTKANFTLALIQAADIMGGPCIDIFTIKKDGVPALELHFDYCTDDKDGDTVGRVKSRDGTRAEDLPRIYNGFQLMGLVDAVLANLLSDSGCEFYGELFFDDQGGPLELPLDFDAMTAPRLPDVDLDLNK